MVSEQSAASIVARLVGDALREAAVLVAVFAPLDVVVQRKTLTLRFAVVTIAVVFVGFLLGAMLEVRQWKKR